MRRDTEPPVPPVPFPPARTVTVPGRGEFFLRDSGGDGATVLLLHGWFASADMNWLGAYDALIAGGYRVLAIDHRGHGRGLRALEAFRLVDCAADAAAVLRETGAAPAIVVGYSMGGAIAQLLARDHPDVASAIVLSGTCQHWQEPQLRRTWKAMGLVSIGLSVAPRPVLRRGFKKVGLPQTPTTAWLMSEITRHSARDLAEAGRELGRFDSRPWLGRVKLPAAVVVTTRDEAVPPRKQRELAQALNAQVFEAPITHLEVTSKPAAYNPALLDALAAMTAVGVLG
ncbi:MAG TPA: alpha/beta fold hydrolase [Solirubrobacteraceae bacterium]|jgi:3-oxoadipate enol-lactonase|nr:alpha/beta fold hydrolase [Solirubrobacteraceae bacterium]